MATWFPWYKKNEHICWAERARMLHQIRVQQPITTCLLRSCCRSLENQIASNASCHYVSLTKESLIRLCNPGWGSEARQETNHPDDRTSSSPGPGSNSSMVSRIRGIVLYPLWLPICRRTPNTVNRKPLGCTAGRPGWISEGERTNTKEQKWLEASANNSTRPAPPRPTRAGAPAPHPRSPGTLPERPGRTRMAMGHPHLLLPPAGIRGGCLRPLRRCAGASCRRFPSPSPHVPTSLAGRSSTCSGLGLARTRRVSWKTRPPRAITTELNRVANTKNQRKPVAPPSTSHLLSF
jgi:hypothetical protein